MLTAWLCSESTFDAGVSCLPRSNCLRNNKPVWPVNGLGERKKENGPLVAKTVAMEVVLHFGPAERRRWFASSQAFHVNTPSISLSLRFPKDRRARVVIDLPMLITFIFQNNNSQIVLVTDGVHCLTCAVMLLNTDLHGQVCSVHTQINSFIGLHRKSNTSLITWSLIDPDRYSDSVRT